MTQFLCVVLWKLSFLLLKKAKAFMEYVGMFKSWDDSIFNCST